MKYSSVVLLGAVSLLAGCMSVSKTAQLAPVGPAPGSQAGAPGDGSLQVYSARALRPADPNLEAHLANNDFGRNDFLYEPARTDYTVYSSDGAVVARVHNRADTDYSQPALVNLAPGSYRVAASVEAVPGSNQAIEVPVVIKSGQLTTLDLEHGLTAQASDPDAVVRLADGRIVGWRAFPDAGHDALTSRSSRH